MPATKPQKPFPKFPLTAHPNGQWSKKILGRVYYFGTWDDPQAALERFYKQKDYLYAGQAPPERYQTLADVLNSFLNRNLRRMEDGEIAERTFNEYKATCDVIESTFGKSRAFETLTHDDLGRLRSILGKSGKGKRVSPVTHKRLLTFARMVFYHANERMGFSVRYKEPLEPPPARLLREARNKIGAKLFAPNEILTLVKNAEPELAAMIYLGINAGFGNEDCRKISIEDIDLVNGFHNFARPKTGVMRRCPLWGDSCSALALVIQDRTSGRVFRRTWNRHVLGRAFKKLAEDCEVYREGISTFYTLRRTFETIATTADVNQAVIDHIMGHAPKAGDMSAVYRQRVFDDSLRRCTDHVLEWLRGSIKLS
jgi:integrase